MVATPAAPRSMTGSRPLASQSWEASSPTNGHAAAGSAGKLLRFLVALLPVPDLLLYAKHLFVEAMVATMSNGTSSALNSEQDLASIPTAQKGAFPAWLSRASKGPAYRWGLFLGVRDTRPEVIAKPEERLSVRSQITLLDEAAIALKDHSIGFTLARDFDPRELGLHALKRVAQQDYQRALVSPPER